MNLLGHEREQLHEALVDAFSSYSALEQMVSFKLNQNLQDIAGNGELRSVAFYLIRWAERSGKLEDLIRDAWEENSGNPKLLGLTHRTNLLLYINENTFFQTIINHSVIKPIAQKMSEN